MPLKIIEDDTGAIAEWAFAMATNGIRHQYDKLFGVFDDNGVRGAFMFTGFNGSEAEVHFYGPRTLNNFVLKTIFRIALQAFNLNRLVVRTRKPAMSRGMRKLRAVYEGRQLRVYGPTDANEHAAECFAFYRERMMEIAKIKEAT